MPGAMHRMGVYLGLVEDDDYADGADGFGPTTERAPARRDDYAESRYPREHAYSRGEPMRDQVDEIEGYANGAYPPGYGPPGHGAPGYEEPYPAYQITTLHPRTYNEARTIGEAFRKSTPVIMNLSEMDDADAKRLVDFAAGLTFGLHGRIERVTAKVFLLSPHNVQVTAQDKARIVETGFFNQS
jgi:cell division inhibitor SepF